MVVMWYVGQRIKFVSGDRRRPAAPRIGIILRISIAAAETQYYVELKREGNYAQMCWVWQQDILGPAPRQLNFFEEVNG